MYKCALKLRGLIVDYDSFENVSVSAWKNLSQLINCVFVTFKPKVKEKINREIGSGKVMVLESYYERFWPNEETHTSVLKLSGLDNTEIAYVSSNYEFIERACCFFCGSVWITNQVYLKDTKILPDLIVDDIESLAKYIERNVMGFFGELSIFPYLDSSYGQLRGFIQGVELDVDGEGMLLYIAGRYFSNRHYMNSLHPYSRALFLNKKDGKAEGVFNNVFTNVFSVLIKQIINGRDVEGVCAVPSRPNKADRFKDILNNISQECKIKNLGDNFRCKTHYPDQKTLNAKEREENIRGVFRYNGDLSGKRVILIDDIVTTGATLRECIRELRCVGATEVIAVVLAVNQIGPTYWSAILPQVSCLECGGHMELWVNQQGGFFYSCPGCYHSSGKSITMDFDDGWKKLCDSENEKFKYAKISDNPAEDEFDFKR